LKVPSHRISATDRRIGDELLRDSMDYRPGACGVVVSPRRSRVLREKSSFTKGRFVVSIKTGGKSIKLDKLRGKNEKIPRIN